MKPGTAVITKQYGLGLYMYPHKRPVRSNTYRRQPHTADCP